MHFLANVALTGCTEEQNRQAQEENLVHLDTFYKEGRKRRMGIANGKEPHKFSAECAAGASSKLLGRE